MAVETASERVCTWTQFGIMIVINQPSLSEWFLFPNVLFQIRIFLSVNIKHHYSDWSFIPITSVHVNVASVNAKKGFAMTIYSFIRFNLFLWLFLELMVANGVLLLQHILQSHCSKRKRK